MAEYFAQEFYGNTILRWFIAFSIIIGGYIASKIAYWALSNVLRKAVAKTKTELDDILLETLEKPILMAIVLAGMWYGVYYLTLSEGIEKFMDQVFYVAIIFNIAWLLVRIVDGITINYLRPIVEKTDTNLDKQVLPLLRKTLKITIWALALIMGLNNAGYNVGALLAGLGIGGIAVAMAAKDTVANLFGGATVFADKPFMIGDRIKTGGFDGFVQEIGFRSTRLRTFGGTIITIPNTSFTASAVENVSAEPSRRMPISIGLTYNTSPAQMQEAKKILGEIVEDNQDIIEETYSASFSGFGDFSLNLTFIYYITKGSPYWETLDKINNDILERFNKAGLDFAFPTQTIHLEKN